MLHPCHAAAISHCRREHSRCFPRTVRSIGFRLRSSHPLWFAVRKSDCSLHPDAFAVRPVWHSSLPFRQASVFKYNFFHINNSPKKFIVYNMKRLKKNTQKGLYFLSIKYIYFKKPLIICSSASFSVRPRVINFINCSPAIFPIAASCIRLASI